MQFVDKHTININIININLAEQFSKLVKKLKSLYIIRNTCQQNCT